jgi:ubiquitin C-terminal hydrolase
LQVDLGEVYQGAERGAHRYRLRSMVCYYGQHYQALVLVPEAGGWLMFDDTRVTRVGAWADVRRKCEAGRIQPSVLFYEAQKVAA